MNELHLIDRWFLPTEWYITINKFVMSVIFFAPLSLIALFESQVARSKSDRIISFFNIPELDEEGDPKIENPSSDDPEGEISTVSFDELVQVFPK